MTKPNDGGPAYPSGNLKFDDGDCMTAVHTGLTKREAFAMAAMQGFCANPQYTESTLLEVAGDAVAAADAVLAELKKE